MAILCQAASRRRRCRWRRWNSGGRCKAPREQWHSDWSPPARDGKQCRQRPRDCSDASTELVASWTQAERRVFDTGCLAAQHETFRFVESVGVGLLAESIAEITQGNAGYVDQLDDAEARMDAAIEVLRATLRRLEPTHMDLVVDGQELSGDYLLVEVMNFGCAGPNLCLVPEAVHSDGLFDVVLADVSHRAQLMDELPLYRRGHHPSTPLPVHSASRLVPERQGAPVASGRPTSRVPRTCRTDRRARLVDLSRVTPPVLNKDAVSDARYW